VKNKSWGATNREITGDFLIANKTIKRKNIEKKAVKAIRFFLTTQKDKLYFKSGNFILGITKGTD